jgi:hypothetical protein
VKLPNGYLAAQIDLNVRIAVAERTQGLLAGHLVGPVQAAASSDGQRNQ